MSSLKQTQQAIQDFILHSKSAEQYIVAPSNGESLDRLQIYRNAYYLRLIDNLTATFPRLATKFGKRDFGLLVRDYLEKYPSRSYSVFNVGTHMIDYLNEQGDIYSSADIEMAVIDWEMSRLLFIDTEPAMTEKAFLSHDPQNWGGLVFKLRSAHVRCDFYYLDEDLNLRDTACKIPIHFILWRDNGKMYYQALSDFEFRLIELLSLGLIFAEVCEQLLKRFDEKFVTQNLVLSLRKFIRVGVMAIT
jgi:hypothetical protein